MQACVAGLKPPRALLTEAWVGELWIAIGEGKGVGTMACLAPGGRRFCPSFFFLVS